MPEGAELRREPPCGPLPARRVPGADDVAPGKKGAAKGSARQATRRRDDATSLTLQGSRAGLTRRRAGPRPSSQISPAARKGACARVAKEDSIH